MKAEELADKWVKRNVTAVHGYCEGKEIFSRADGEAIGEAAFLAGYQVGLSADRWVSCAERMPDMGVTVMWYEPSPFEQMWFGHVDDKGRTIYYKGDKCESDKRFTHWLSLPAAPKGECLPCRAGRAPSPPAP
jgi:hypothetical protein